MSLFIGLLFAGVAIGVGVALLPTRGERAAGWRGAGWGDDVPESREERVPVESLDARVGALVGELTERGQVVLLGGGEVEAPRVHRVDGGLIAPTVERVLEVCETLGDCGATALVVVGLGGLEAAGEEESKRGPLEELFARATVPVVALLPARELGE